LLVLNAVGEGREAAEGIHHAPPIPEIDDAVRAARMNREARGLPVSPSSSATQTRRS
jgi:hypothetical protein